MPSVARRKPKTIEFYTSIEDIPIWNHDKVGKTDNFKYLVKNVNYKDHIDFDKEKATEIWESMSDEYVDNFGISNQFRRALKLGGNIVLLQSKFQRTKKAIYKSRLTRELLILEAKKPSQNQSLMSQIVIVSKHLGYRIDAKVISALEFFTCVNDMNKSVENG